MNTITINNKDYAFKFGFKALKNLMESEKLTFAEMGEWGQSLANVAKIAYYGIDKKITLEEIENDLDKKEWKDVLSIITLFSEEVGKYFGSQSPNESATMSN
jgi:hypothetical protein